MVDLFESIVDFAAELVETALNFIVDKVLGPVIEAVVEPILEFVLTEFSKVMSDAISKIMPIIEKFLIDIAKPIFDLIISVINAIFVPIKYTMFAGILKFIDLLENVFDVFSGITKVTYNKNDDFLINVFFRSNAINRVFWSITILAIAILIVFTIIAIIKNMSNLDSDQTVGQIIGLSLKAMIILFIVPFISLILLNLSSIVLTKTSEIVTVTQSGESTPSLGTLTFLTFTMKLARNDEYNQEATLTDDLRAPYMLGKKDYSINGMGDFAVEKINYFLAFIVCGVMALIIVLCALVFIVKIFEVLILYITSPFFVATMVLDGGVKFKEWCKMFIAKMLGGFGMVIAMKLFFIISPIIMSSKVVFSTNDLTNLLAKSFFLIGGLWAAYKSGNLIIQIININAAYQEAGLSSEFATRAVRAGIKYGTVAVKAIATGGATLAMDAKNIALDAGRSVGEAVVKGEDSGGEKSAPQESNNAFRGGSSLNQAQNKNFGGLNSSSGLESKVSAGNKFLKK